MLRKSFFDLLPTLRTPILPARVIWSLAIEMMHLLRPSSVSFEDRRYHNVMAIHATISPAIEVDPFCESFVEGMNQ
jgi:hypothetical protein